MLVLAIDPAGSARHSTGLALVEGGRLVRQSKERVQIDFVVYLDALHRLLGTCDDERPIDPATIAAAVVETWTWGPHEWTKGAARECLSQSGALWVAACGQVGVRPVKRVNAMTWQAALGVRGKGKDRKRSIVEMGRMMLGAEMPVDVACAALMGLWGERQMEMERRMEA